MYKYWLLLFLMSMVPQAYSQNKPAYQIFNAKGKRISYGKMKKKLASKDIVLFGEIHNNPIDHWLQLELLQDLFQVRKTILGFEMFEADNQEPLDRYLKGELEQIDADSTMRLWGNYHTDYAPLVEFAKMHHIPVIATNVPAQYAKNVYRYGFKALEGLDEKALSYIAPQPMPFDPDLKTYQDILEMMAHHGTPELVMAQALRDATMAHFILKYYQPGTLFLHMNGTYHSEYYEGILWYLRQSQPTLQYGTIATTDQPSLKKLLEENKGKADFIICVDENMAKTH
ncbi:MAG: ChaN family lipoprotein [Saprospiraceae bacterium]|nr:ChaN family lipoprotein [Saprospiraceae bacterium]